MTLENITYTDLVGMDGAITVATLRRRILRNRKGMMTAALRKEVNAARQNEIELKDKILMRK